MGRNDDIKPEDVSCIMCNESDENTITGPLSSKEDISAHQNCLLYSSGLYCKNSPSFDDLFGFDVDDVKKEHRRGKKLTCHYCKKKGATVGCERKSCIRSYHYPCASRDDARAEEDKYGSTFKVFCKKHDPHHRSANLVNDASNTRDSTPFSKRSELNQSRRTTSSSELNLRHPGSTRGKAVRQAGFNKANCRQLFSKSDSETIGSSSRKRTSINLVSSESDESDLMIPPLDSDPEESTPAKKHKTSTPDSQAERDQEEPSTSASGGAPHPNGDGDETDIDMDITSPSLLPPEVRFEQVSFNVIVDSGPSIETDNSVELCSPAESGPAAAVSNSQEPLSGLECAVHTESATPLNPPQPSQPSAHSPPLSKGAAAKPDASSHEGTLCEDVCPIERPARPSSKEKPEDVSDDLPEHQVTLHRDCPLDLTTPPVSSTEPPQPSEGPAETACSDTNAALFWRRCNEIGCTEAIFAELTRQVNSLAERVQNGHATQQECGLSLRILKASGKLPVIFKQLDKDFEEQERELWKKREALKDARTALNHLS